MTDNLSFQELEDLRQIFKHILIDPNLLVTAAAQRGVKIRRAYISVLRELKETEAEIALVKSREGVK